MIVLGADLATRSGVTYDRPDGSVVHDSHRCPGAREGDYGPLFLSFDVWWCRTLAAAQPARVAFESPMRVVGFGKSTRPTNQGTLRVVMGLAAIAELRCAERGIPCFEVNISTVKKHFTGSGKAEKADMMKMCRTLGWPVEDNDQADAAALWSYVKSVNDPAWAPRATPLFARAGR